MHKNLFSVVVWGEKYTSYFSDISIPTLLTSKNLALLKPNSKNTFFIITTYEDKKRLENNKSLKILKKYLDIEYQLIEKPGEQFFENKYKVLSNFQSYILQYSSGYNYVHFLYPDFVYSNGAFASIFKAFKNNSSAVAVPIPRINTFEYVEKTQGLTIKDLSAKYINYGFEKHCFPLFTDGQKSFYCDDQTTSVFPSTMMWKIRHAKLRKKKIEHNILFKCFHLHPISLKVQHDNPRMNADFTISFDEEYISNLFPDIGSFYIPNTSKEMAICSLDDNHPATVNKDNNLTVLRLSRFAERYASVLHRSFVELNYMWETGLSDKNDEKKVKNNATNLVNKIQNRLRIPSDVLKQTDYYSYVERKKREKIYTKNIFLNRGLPPIFFTFSKKRLFLVLITCQIFSILTLFKILKIFPFIGKSGGFLSWYRHIGILYTNDEYAAVKIRMLDFYLFWVNLIYKKSNFKNLLLPINWVLNVLLVSLPKKTYFFLKQFDIRNIRKSKKLLYLRYYINLYLTPLFFIIFIFLSFIIYVYSKFLNSSLQGRI